MSQCNCKLTYLQHLYLICCSCKQKVIHFMSDQVLQAHFVFLHIYIQTLVSIMDRKPTAASVTVSWNNGRATCMFLTGLLANKCSFRSKFAWPIRKQKIVRWCFLSLLLCIRISNSCIKPCYSIISNCGHKEKNTVNSLSKTDTIKTDSNCPSKRGIWLIESGGKVTPVILRS